MLAGLRAAQGDQTAIDYLKRDGAYELIETFRPGSGEVAKPMTTGDLRAMLRKRFAFPDYLFLEEVANGTFSDDGTGYPVREGKYDPSLSIEPPSSFLLPEDATHVVWFSK